MIEQKVFETERHKGKNRLADDMSQGLQSLGINLIAATTEAVAIRFGFLLAV